jgi:hypothetical protein
LLYCCSERRLRGAVASERGLRGAVDLDILHVTCEGWHKYCLEGLFGSKCVSTQAQKRKNKRQHKEVNHQTERVHVAKEHADDRVSSCVFTDKMQKQFDELTIHNRRALQHPSDRNFPHQYFSSGSCSQAIKPGNERQGVVLLIMIMFCSIDGDQFENAMGQETFGLYTCTIELLVMLEQYSKAR